MDHNAFYRVVKQSTGEDSRARVNAATAAVLHALRDRITPEEADQVRAQLPAVLKEVWDAGEEVNRHPLRMDRRAFYARVQRDAGLSSQREARWATLGVFAALKEQLTPGEADDVMAQLPRDLKETWAEALRVA